MKTTNTWKLSNTLLNDQEVSEEIKEEIKKYLKTKDNENMLVQNLHDATEVTLREVYWNTILPQVTRKISIK